MKTKKRVLVFFVVGLIAFGIPLWGQSRTTGLLPIPRDLRLASQQAVMSRLNLGGEELPSRVDLAEGVIIARDQGRIGSCGPFSVSATLTVMLRTRDKLPISNRSWHSPSFLYSQVMIGNDMGSTFYDNLELAKTAGIATAITFPYTEDTRLRPGPEAFREAQRFKISEWRRIQHDDVNTFKTFLAKGYPVMISIKVYDNFFTFDHQGGIYYPSGAPTNSFHGVAVIGYDDVSGTYTAQNSYGSQWGNGKGCFRFTYETLRNGSLVQEAYIMVPAALNSAAPLFPAGVAASMGIYSDKVKITWQPAANALEYEVFRLDSVKPADPREEQYVSLGMTNNTSFEDPNVRQDHRYFYLVRTHSMNISSDLSFPVEGWSSAVRNTPPGPPFGFRAMRQAETVVCTWDSAEADRYFVYSWRIKDSAWVKVGETTETFFVDTKPVREGKSLISYMAVAENRWGTSVASNVSSVSFDDAGNEGDIVPDEGGNEKYRGKFYSFPSKKFIEAEKIFFANFQRDAAKFNEKFIKDRKKLFNVGGGK